MGRGHLILLVLALGAGALALGAAAQAGRITWRTVSRGPSGGPPVSRPLAYLALTRAAATAKLSSRLGDAGRARLARIDFSRDALVAVFGEFGCNDPLVIVTSISRRGRMLAVKLVQRRPPTGTALCMALYPTYRFLLVAKRLLHRPYPTHAKVSLARA